MNGWMEDIERSLISTTNLLYILLVDADGILLSRVERNDLLKSGVILICVVANLLKLLEWEIVQR